MKKIIIFVIVVLVVSVGWYLISPAFIDDTVNEDLPDEFTSLTDEEFTLPTAEEFELMTEEEKKTSEMEMIKMFEDKSVEVDDPMEEESIEPALVKSGIFQDADSFHKGSGVARILKSDSWNLLRLEDFNVTNGPALVVLLSTNPNPKDSDDLGEYIKLSSLKGNMGNQNYEIPDGTDLEKYNSVVIYCEPFHVVFSIASLVRPNK